MEKYDFEKTYLKQNQKNFKKKWKLKNRKIENFQKNEILEILKISKKWKFGNLENFKKNEILKFPKKMEIWKFGNFRKKS